MTSQRERMRELGRKGGKSRQAKLRAARGPIAPYTGTVIDLLDLAGLVGPSWVPWRAFLRAIFALPMDVADLAVYQQHTARQTPPATPARQVYAVCGRRAGKTRVGSLVAIYIAIRRDYHALLAPGESAVIPLLAVDKDQAAIALSYVRGTLHSPPFLPFVRRFLRDSIELKTGAKIVVKAASMRTTRGFSTPCIIADELAHWRSDESSEPDKEILTALMPGMLALPEPVLLGLSTPHGKAGVLFENFDRHFGRDSDVLVWQSPSAEMNALLDQAEIARELEQDPEKNAAEYLATFRTDVQSFVNPEAVERAINRSRPLELPWRAGLRYKAHVDPSGGASDSACLGIAHREGERALGDVAREWRSPHVPEDVVQEMVDLLRAYHLTSVTTDRYAPGWVADAFRRRGIECGLSSRAKSELYLAVLGPLNSGRVELPNEARVKQQLLGLERRTARGGKDSVDHRAGGKDDLINALTGALVLALNDTVDDVSAAQLDAANRDLANPSQWSGWRTPGGGTPRELQSIYPIGGGGMFGNSRPRPDIAR